MSLTSPEDLGRAITRAAHNSFVIGSGTKPAAIIEQTLKRFSAVNESDIKTRRCSYLQPLGPHPDPLGAVFMLVMN